MTIETPAQTTATAEPAVKAFLHCPICTHTVSGQVVRSGRNIRVKPGQSCSRCRGALDAAYVLRLDQTR